MAVNAIIKLPQTKATGVKKRTKERKREKEKKKERKGREKVGEGQLI